MTREAMLGKVPVPPENIFPIPTDGEPEDAARVTSGKTRNEHLSPGCHSTADLCGGPHLTWRSGLYPLSVNKW